MRDAFALGDDRQGVGIPLRQLAGPSSPWRRRRPAAWRRRACGGAPARGPDSSTSTISQLRPITTGTPSLLTTTLRFLICTVRIERGLDARLLGAALHRAADVEGAHGELGARLADRLRGDDADRLADIDRRAARQIAAVALARRRRAWSRRSGPSGSCTVSMPARVDLLDLRLVDQLAGLDDELRRSAGPSRPPPRCGRGCARRAAR